MAKTASADFVTRVKRAIEKGLTVAGISSKIQAEPIPGTNLHRFLVVAQGFAALRPSERQDLVWRIMSQEFSPEEQLRISMIVTLAPQEMMPENHPQAITRRKAWRTRKNEKKVPTR